MKDVHIFVYSILQHKTVYSEIYQHVLSIRGPIWATHNTTSCYSLVRNMMYQPGGILIKRHTIIEAVPSS